MDYNIIIDKISNILNKNINIINRHHICLVLDKKNNCLSYGINDSRGISGNSKGIVHAEISAVLKLHKNKKKNKKINLFVVKISKTNSLSNSKPCIKCINDLITITLNKGYRINKIYYSNENNKIICKKFIDLILEKDKFITSFYKHFGFNTKKLEININTYCKDFIR